MIYFQKQMIAQCFGIKDVVVSSCTLFSDIRCVFYIEKNFVCKSYDGQRTETTQRKRVEKLNFKPKLMRLKRCGNIL